MPATSGLADRETGNPQQPCLTWPYGPLSSGRAPPLPGDDPPRAGNPPSEPAAQLLAVIATGSSVEDVISRLTHIQAEHPGAQVRRGKRNAWGIWSAPTTDQRPARTRQARTSWKRRQRGSQTVSAAPGRLRAEASAYSATGIYTLSGQGPTPLTSGLDHYHSMLAPCSLGRAGTPRQWPASSGTRTRCDLYRPAGSLAALACLAGLAIAELKIVPAARNHDLTR
jgi:hypothetical protein